MANQTDLQIISEIAKKFGSVINLEETPTVLAEILRVYGCQFAIDPPPQGSGGVQSGTIAGITGGTVGGGTGKPGDVPLSEIWRGILQVQKEVRSLRADLKKNRGKVKPKAGGPSKKS